LRYKLADAILRAEILIHALDVRDDIVYYRALRICDIGGKGEGGVFCGIEGEGGINRFLITKLKCYCNGNVL
jgi:hypothetical protein